MLFFFVLKMLIIQVILCIFCTANSILTLVRAFSFAYGGLRAAVKVHDTLLNRLINAPVQFFDQTPGGRILNRLEFLSAVPHLSTAFQFSTYSFYFVGYLQIYTQLMILFPSCLTFSWPILWAFWELQ